MSIRILTVGGVVVGYQAVVGVGGPGMTAYVSARQPNAWQLAQQKSEELHELHAATLKKKKAPALGVKVISRPRKNKTLSPIKAIRVTWKDGGKTKGTSFSVAVHGELDATTLAIRRKEAATKQPFGMAAQTLKVLLFPSANT